MDESQSASSEVRSTVPPPRLHVLMRPETNKAVLLRRGGSKVYCSIGWDLTTDDFSVGQWCKHKIYPQRCDISPDGRWMVYFALNGRWQSETRGSFTAVSRAPYLKAICLSPQGDTWGGGGLFVSDGEPPASGLGQLFASLRHRNRFHLVTGARASYQSRLQRDGWRLGTHGFEKPIGHNFILHKIVRGEPKELHRLHGLGGAEIELTGWEWAEFDAPRKRVLWAEQGTIRWASVGREGLGIAHQLFDARPMAFEALPAPYDDQTMILK